MKLIKRNMRYGQLGRIVREDSLSWNLFKFAILRIEPRSSRVLFKYCIPLGYICSGIVLP
jgi:hypothetical protein